MKNEELRTGMILVTEKNEYVMVLKDTENGDIVSGDTWQPIYKDTEIVEDLKVKKIYQPLNNKAYLNQSNGFEQRDIEISKNHYKALWGIHPLEDYKLIWERKESKKMTVAEICKELGYEVEIVKE